MKLGHLIVLLVFAGTFLLGIRALYARNLLSLRYAAGWMTVGLLFLFFPVLLIIGRGLSDWIAVRLSIIYTAPLLIVLLIICVQLTISISGLTRQIRTLAEELALLENELRRRTKGPMEEKNEQGNS